MTPPKPRPFRDGREAFGRGEPIGNNPYTPGQTTKTYKGDMHQAWVYGWKEGEMDDLLAKSPVPDLTLIAEAEILIPKGFYWCGHELNRTLHYYRDACDEKDASKIKGMERALRRALVNARLEAAGLPVK